MLGEVGGVLTGDSIVGVFGRRIGVSFGRGPEKRKQIWSCINKLNINEFNSRGNNVTNCIIELTSFSRISQDWIDWCFNATFNILGHIMAVSFIGGGNRRTWLKLFEFFGPCARLTLSDLPASPASCTH